MTSDLCSEDVVVHITAPQIITSESVVSGTAGAGARAAPATATVELGRRLLLAARAGDTPLVLDLMAKGAPFTTDWLGTSPLHLAASNAHVETCAVLLRAGFSRDARTKVQRTPLHLAACAGHAGVARLLLEAGAGADTRDMLRMTPLHWAVQRGHARVALELLRRGADPAALSKFHKTPHSIAVETRRDDIVKMIEDALKEREAAESVDALVNEQMAEAPTDPHLQMFDTVQRLEDIKQSKHTQVERKTKMDTTHIESSNIKRDDLIKIIEDAIKDRGTKTSDTGLTIVNEQIVDTPLVETHLQSFDTVPRIQEVKMNKLKQESSTKTDTPIEAPAGARLLRAHGITLLPADRGSTVLSALQSGRTVVLSDAGKLMLKESSSQGGGAAAAVAAPAARGVKIFTLNNSLRARPRHAPAPATKIINPQDMQVKFVQLPPDAKIVSPSKLVAMKSKPRLARPPAVKIIMNKSNFNKLIASTTQPTLAHNGIEATVSNTRCESTPPAPPAAPAASVAAEAEAEAAVRVPEQFLRSTSPRYLRAQLLAAHRALAARSAELAAARARLAKYEPL